MLKEWGRVSQADIDRIDMLFNKLDRDSDGVLDPVRETTFIKKNEGN